jgi:hypothetical protein
VAEQITIPVAIAEITMDYAHPHLQLFGDLRVKVVSELFDRYKPWNVEVDDIEPITQGRLSEQGVKVKIQKLRASFFFGPSQCRLTWDDASWPSAGEAIQILTIGTNVLTEIAGLEIANFKSAISLHLQPKTKPFIELIGKFAAPQLLALHDSPLNAFATVVKWGDRRITIDGSAQIANGIFLKFEREFPSVLSVEEIVTALKRDEDELLALLDVEEANA